VALLLGAAIVLSQIQLARNRVSASTLHTAQIGSCHRNNSLREYTNDVSRRNLTLVELIIEQRTKEVGVQRHLPGYLVKLYRLRSQVAFIPRIDCEQAVDHPLSYMPPPPARFVR